MNTVGSTENDDVQVVINGTQSPTAHTVSLQETGENIASLTSTASVQTVLLATALVKAESVCGNYQLLRSLIDQGSQASFITEAAAQLLGLKRTATSTAVAGLGGDKRIVAKAMVMVSIQFLHDPGYNIQVKAYILDKITAHLPSITLEVASWPELVQISLADPSYNTPNKIDILLGAEVYGQIIKDGLIKYPSGSPIAQNTALGWILSGQTRQTSCETIVNMHIKVDELLKLFWETEKEPLTTKKIMTEEEKKCEKIFEETTKRDIEGRYIVKLPFRDENPNCLKGHSRSIATKMFFNRERRLQNNRTLKDEYIKTFNEYIELNHMELVPENESYTKKENCFYIPYPEVIREDRTTTKVRIVFHASIKGTNGVSLNDDLMVGPSLQSELRHLIMRWRVYPIVFTADVIKMYRQIKVDERDADFQRIIWRDEPQKKLEEHRMLRLTFGTASAPYLAVRCLIQVAIDEAKDFPLAAEIVKRDFYMDDLMSGCFSENESLILYEQISEMLKRGGFILQKWITNSEKLIHKIQETKVDAVKKFEIKLEEKNKILGLTWNRKNDEFEYAVQLMPVSSPIIKRKVIADIAKLYDPMGWIAPTVIKAKILIQKIWLSGINWDQELPSELLDEWLKYRNDIIHLTKVRIPRWLNRQKDDSLVELHGFCDASNAAYAAVVYTRNIDAQGNVHVSLVTAKIKVAPIKQISIPRLELNGAVLVTKLLIEVSQLLNIPRGCIRAWTDSEVVLAWLSSHPNKWKTYVANRVSEIVSHLERSHWAHVPSEINPADCASRGVAPSDIHRNTMWFNGPDWLKGKVLNYETKLHMQTNLEENTQKIKTHAAVLESIDSTIWSKFSSMKKLLRVVAYCRRVLKYNRKCHIYLIKEEIEDALKIMIKISQMEGFYEEIKDIRGGKEVKNKSKLTSYNPYIDELGILRVGGRLDRADIKEESKHPILIPHNSFLTKLLVSEAHEKTLHGGPLLMLTYLRSKYWILGAKNLVKFHFRKCVTCIRHSASSRSQLMGQLPSPRANMHRAFLHCGIDYAGPIQIRMSKGRGNRSYKGYICLFICLSTKAIHLEAVSDLTSNGFLAAYKRFVARRGHCSDLYSDNGTNFVGAARELKILFDKEKSNFIPEIVDWLATKQCKWHFIPPYAPNFGGLWEASIKSTKHHLKRVIGNSTLTFEEMTTTLAQIEACLNSRPMSYIEDQGEPMPLTPGHFLIGEPLVLAPDRSYELSTISSLRRWQLCQRMLQDFWRRWSQEYLTRFMQRYRWTQITPEPNIGDIVLVQEPDLPPAKWLLGRITEKHPGLDKITRVVTLKHKNSYIKRPISKICVLPVSN